MADGNSPRSRRRIGLVVQKLWPPGLTQEDLAKTVGTTRQTVARLISGEVLVAWPTVCAILVELGASRETIHMAKERHQAASVATASIEHARDMPAKYKSFRMDEAEATRSRTLDQSLFPGLLQTARYAEECSRRAWRRIKGETWNEQAAAERRDRQSVLYRDAKPLHLHALIDESALLRIVDSRDVMLEQLTHLIDSSQRPNITIQTIPLAVGAYGAHSSPLILLSFDEPDEPDAAFIEGWTGLEHVDPKDVDAMNVLSAVWDDVAALARNENDSVQAIKEARDRVSNT